MALSENLNLICKATNHFYHRNEAFKHFPFWKIMFSNRRQKTSTKIRISILGPGICGLEFLWILSNHQRNWDKRLLFNFAKMDQTTILPNCQVTNVFLYNCKFYNCTVNDFFRAEILWATLAKLTSSILLKLWRCSICKWLPPKRLLLKSANQIRIIQSYQRFPSALLFFRNETTF